MALNTEKPFSGRMTLFGSTSTTNENAVGIPILIEADGTLRIQSVLFHSGTTQIREKAETDGTPTVSNYGKAGGTLTAFKVETTGEQDNVLHGKDEASNIDALRTDPNRILWQRRFRQLVQLDSVVIASSDGILLDGSASLAASAVYEITFEVVNVDGTNSVSVDVYVDIAAGGTAGAAEYVLQDAVIPAGGSSGEIRLTMASDDDIRGVAGAADDAAIRFIRVERVDNGA